MKKISPLALFALSATALLAADFSFDGRWLVEGVPQTRITTTCTVSFYSSANAASPVATLFAVPFTTDRDGYFVVSTNAPSTLPDTFWAGVAPAGHGEISPRFRVAPAPFALAAVEAALVTNKTQFTLSGEAVVERLDVSGDMVAGDFTGASGQEIKAANLRADSLRLSSLELAGGSSIGLFDTTSGVSSPDYDTFPSDMTVSAKVSINRDLGGSYSRWYPRTETRTSSCSFDTDGILLIALKSTTKAEAPVPAVSVKVGSASIHSAYPVGTAGSANTVKRLMSIPYRAGETVSVTAHAWETPDAEGEFSLYKSQDRYETSIGAKVKLVRFGRK